MKVLNKVKTALVEPDGSLNGKVLAGLIGLALLAIQEIASLFGFRLKGDLNTWVSVINIILTFLGALGVVTSPTPVEVQDLNTKTASSESAASQTPVVSQETATEAAQTSNPSSSEAVQK